MKKVFCECGTELMVVERCGQCYIMACIHCDMPQEDVKVYENTCWSCGYGIDSRYSQASIIPGMGYHCGRCGKDLTEWKLRHGLITAAELLKITGRQKHDVILQPLCDEAQLRDPGRETVQR